MSLSIALSNIPVSPYEYSNAELSCWTPAIYISLKPTMSLFSGWKQRKGWTSLALSRGVTSGRLNGMCSPEPNTPLQPWKPVRSKESLGKSASPLSVRWSRWETKQCLVNGNLVADQQKENQNFHVWLIHPLRHLLVNPNNIQLKQNAVCSVKTFV